MRGAFFPAFGGALIGVVVGYVAANAFKSPPAPSEEMQSVLHTEDLAKALRETVLGPLEDMRSELQAIRKGIDAAKTTGDGEPQDLPAAAEAISRPIVTGANAAAEHVVLELLGRDRAAATSLRREVVSERVLTLHNWEEDVALRKRWLFVSERDLLEWFGMPDEVWVSEGTEQWSYRFEADEASDAESDLPPCRLYVHDGRLIGVSFAL